jgi:VanZ family protein
MSNEQRGTRFWVSAWLPVILCTLLVAVSSTPWFSASETSGPFRWLWQSIFGPVSNPTWGFIHLCIRKTAHFVGYGLIGLTWLRAWRLTFPHMRFFSDAVLAVVGTAVISSCDEFHQTFLPSRTGSPWDVLLDCCGATAMCVIAFLILRLTGRPRASRRPNLHREPERDFPS